MTQRSYSMADAYNSIYSQPTKSVSLREALDVLDEEDVEYILDKLKEKGFTEGLSIEDQMRISKEHNRKSPEERKKANQAILGKVKKEEPKKDTRSDSEKMADATDERPGSFYRRFGK